MNDGRTDGRRTHGRKDDALTDSQTHGLTYSRTHGLTDSRTHGLTDDTRHGRQTHGRRTHANLLLQGADGVVLAEVRDDTTFAIQELDCEDHGCA